MPTDLIRARVRPAVPISNTRNGSIVAAALTAALVTLQLVGLVVLERSHAHAMQVAFPRGAPACAESATAPVAQIPYD